MLKRKGLFPFLFAFLIFVIGFFLKDPVGQKPFAKRSDFSEFLEKRQAYLQKELSNLFLKDQSSELFSNPQNGILNKKIEPLFYYIEEEGKLLYWSEEDSPIDLKLLHHEGVLVSNSFALFLKAEKQEGNKRYYVLEQILRKYPYDNSYLQTYVSEDWKPYLDQEAQFKDWN